jgi:hypothetical protein
VGPISFSGFVSGINEAKKASSPTAIAAAGNGMIYLLGPNQYYGSGTSQSEETNKVKDPVIPEPLAYCAR